MSIKKYYVSANTAEGFIHRLESNLLNIHHIIPLQHPSLKKNTAILRRIIEENKDQTDIEILMSPLSSHFLEGVILREKQTAILNQSFRPPASFHKAYESFAAGLKIHDDIEKIYIGEMDFKKADSLAEKLIRKLLENIPAKEREPHVYKRFFGTNTFEGIVNEVPHIISDLDTVYHIKGREGTGKSTFMKKVAEACINHGFDIELYRCSFDPGSIDMVLVPELNICLFDSTDPHAFEPADPSKEKVIDLYEEAVTKGTDEKYAAEITRLTKDYKDYMKKGLKILQDEIGQIIQAEEKTNVSSDEIEKEVDRIQSALQKQ